MVDYGQFWEYLRTLPTGQELSKADLLNRKLLIAEEGLLRVYYAPLDWWNPEAKVALVGLTPGWGQMQIAYRTAIAAIQEGLSPVEACRLAKAKCAFEGPMRANLIEMLDDVSLPEMVGVKRASDLFEADRATIHTTSVFRYPVFYREGNYSGYRPKATRCDFLLSQTRQSLCDEADVLRRTAVIPLGRMAEDVLDVLSEELFLSGNVIRGFPHPSPQNGHRRRLFKQNRASIVEQLHRVLSTAAR